MNPLFALRPALAATVVLAALAVSPPAAATVNYHASSPGAVCHAANPGATKFVAANQYLTNGNTTAQYVMCALAVVDPTDIPRQLAFLQMEIQSGGEGSAVTCVLQTGYYGSGALTVRSSSSKTYTFVTVGGTNTFYWDAGSVVRDNTTHVLTLNCKMDPGTRLGTILYGDT
jgi:hypothetical protein